MANIGLKSLKYALLNADGTTYGTITSMGGAISASISPNFAEASLYYDDALGEYVTAFQNATITLGVDHDSDSVFAELLGKTTISDVTYSSINDVAPYVGVGYIATRIKNNVQEFRAQFFPKVKFKPFISDANTKGDSVEFGTVSVEGLTIANSLGYWEYHSDVATEAAAITALNAFFVQETGGG
jgi:phi13 family phage major tail protein